MSAVGRNRLKYLLPGLPFLPLLLVLIPDSFCVPLDPEKPCPWYALFTTLPVALSAQFLAPATLIASLMDANALSAAWWCVCLLYTSIVSFGIYLVLRRVEKRRTG